MDLLTSSKFDLEYQESLRNFLRSRSGLASVHVGSTVLQARFEAADRLQEVKTRFVSPGHINSTFPMPCKPLGAGVACLREWHTFRLEGFYTATKLGPRGTRLLVDVQAAMGDRIRCEYYPSFHP